MRKKEDDNRTEIQVDIGQIYREAREAANIALKEAHFSTQLSVEVLEHIENNQFSKIGASVYVRGYLGIYARYLGLDAKHILGIFEAQNASTPIEIRPSLAQTQSIGGRKLKSKRHSKTLSTLVVLIVLAGLAYGYYLLKPLLFSDIQSTVTQPEVETQVTPEPMGDNLDSLLTEADATLNSANEVIGTSSGQGNVSNNELRQEVEVDINSFLAEGARVGGNSSGESPTIEAEENSVVELESAGEPSATANTDDTATSTAKSLEIKFTQDCWVKITDIEGKVLTSKLYKKDSSLNVSGLPPLSLVIGNQDGVGEVSYAGEPISLTDFKTGNISYTLN